MRLLYDNNDMVVASATTQDNSVGYYMRRLAEAMLGFNTTASPAPPSSSSSGASSSNNSGGNNNNSNDYTSWYWGRRYPCTGLECKVQVAPLIISAIVLVMVLYVVAVVIWSRYAYLKSLKKGSVPATMLVGQWLASGKDRGDVKAFTFMIRKPQSREEVKEEDCPVCLKNYENPKKWVMFTCGHATCERCFRRMMARQRLFTNCPLCRHYIAQGDGDRGTEGRLAAGAVAEEATEQVGNEPVEDGGQVDAMATVEHGLDDENMPACSGVVVDCSDHDDHGPVTGDKRIQDTQGSSSVGPKEEEYQSAHDYSDSDVESADEKWRHGEAIA